MYVQEQWTAGRLTYQGALRYDYASSYFPGTADRRRTASCRTNVVIPRTIGVTGYHDLTPRGGVAWDLFGDGKTAVKINGGRYLQNAVADKLYSGTNPLGSIPVSVTRSWMDANNNFSPDCNLMNLREQDLRGSGRRLLRHGQRPELRHADSERHVRPGAARRLGRAPGRLAIRRLHPAGGPAACVGRGRLYRRWLVNFSVQDNLAVTPADFDTFSVDGARRSATADRRAD